MIVRIGERVLADQPLRGQRFSLRVELPRREVAVRVTAVTAAGRRSSTVVSNVVGLPSSAVPRAAAARLHAGLGRSVRALTRAFPGTSAVYVEDLATGGFQTVRELLLRLWSHDERETRTSLPVVRV